MINSVFNVATTGLRAAQLGLDATANNVANVDTPYYIRDTLDLQEQNFNTGPLSAGDGVKASVVKLGTGGFPQHLQDALASEAAGQTTLDLANQFSQGLQNSQLSQKLTDFYNSFSDLGSNPSSDSARQTVIAKANDLSQSVNSLSNLSTTIQSQTQYDNQIDTQQFNSLLGQIAQINANATPSDSLQAQRNDLMGQLGAIASVQSPDNGKTIYLKTPQGQGMELLNGSKVDNFKDSDLAQAASGKIGARSQFVNSTMPDILSGIASSVKSIVDNVNNAHEAGYDENGNPGKAIFSYNTSDVLGTLSNNIENTQDIAAASTTTTSGNGNNALSIFNLGATDGQAMTESMGVANAKLGGVISKATNDAKPDESNNLLSQWKNQFGVNLDEEGVNTLKYQKMYEANAKVLQVADSMMGTLLDIVA